jgi:catechol 2,3-dioxygenase-like lactoylglutathione lyase family enzyme
MQSLTLDGVHILCHDMKLMSNFYTDILGLEQCRELVPFPDGPQDPWIDLKTGRASLVLKPYGTFDGDRRPTNMASVHIGLRVETSTEVDAHHDRLVAKGVDFSSPPVDWPWNDRACFFHDPEGNLLEIFYAPTAHPVPQDARHTEGVALLLDTVHIPCNDLKIMNQFYRSVIGLEKRREMVPFPDGPQDPWPEFKTGTTSLVLKPHGRYDGDPRTSAMAGCHLGFGAATSEQVDAHYRRLVAEGVEFASPPVDWPWNERACFWHDPEGNLLEIYHDANALHA